jgi:hypothetical protein
MIIPFPRTSCRLSAADHARLGRLRDRCRGLVDRAQGSLDRSSALLRRLARHPRAPDWSRPATGPGGGWSSRVAVDADPGALWGVAAAASRKARAMIEWATREVARAAADAARARELRHESRALRWAHAALGPLPPPAPTVGAGGGARMWGGCGGRPSAQDAGRPGG